MCISFLQKYVIYRNNHIIKTNKKSPTLAGLFLFPIFSKRGGEVRYFFTISSNEFFFTLS